MEIRRTEFIITNHHMYASVTLSFCNLNIISWCNFPLYSYSYSPSHTWETPLSKIHKLQTTLVYVKNPQIYIYIQVYTENITAAETCIVLMFSWLYIVVCGMLAFGCALTEKLNFPAVHFNNEKKFSVFPRL